jgi:hypothetical protein
MELKITVNGVQATLTVKDATEAVSVLSLLGANSGERQPSVSNETSHAIVPVDEVLPTPIVTVDASQMREALLHIQGTDSARILKTITANHNGCTDAILRQQMLENYGTSENASWGPLFSNISKACKKFNVPLEAVLLRKSKRAPKGKFRYFYRVTEEARRLIDSIRDFDKSPEFDDLFK